jgi:pyruvate dehydrogenase E2 component (dihydrolipoamide acetyltransferase)
MKACTCALQRFPDLNASLSGDTLIQKQYYHLGFAADTPEGLVVPVIRDVDSKSVTTVAKEMATLAAKAREGKLRADDMAGGTFSISSLGGIGGKFFTPIINAPEVAILGLGRSQWQLTWEGDADFGKAVPRLVLPLSMSWDHRALDGAQAAKFLTYLAKLLQDFRRVAV